MQSRAKRCGNATTLLTVPAPSKAGVPNISLKMHPFNNSPNEHVPYIIDIFNNKHIMIFENNIQ